MKKNVFLILSLFLLTFLNFSYANSNKFINIENDGSELIASEQVLVESEQANESQISKSEEFDLSKKIEKKSKLENFQNEALKNPLSNKVKDLKRFSNIKKIIPKAKENSSSGGDMMILLIILAIIIPFVAVGIYTNWDLVKTLIALLLTILGWLPGVVYALLVIFDVI